MKTLNKELAAKQHIVINSEAAWNLPDKPIAVSSHASAFLDAAIGSGEMTQAQLDAFLTTPAETDVAVATELAQAAGQANYPSLDGDQRGTVTLQIDGKLIQRGNDTVRALRRSTDVAQKSQVGPDDLGLVMKQGVATTRFNRAAVEIKQVVDDGHLIVQAWQYQARATVAAAIFAGLSDPSKDAGYKRQLVVDAADIFEREEALLTQLQGQRQMNAGQVSDLQGQIADVQQATLLIQTLRDLRANIMPDPDTLRAVAAYYVGLQAQAPSSSTHSSGAAGTSANQRRQARAR